MDTFERLSEHEVDALSLFEDNQVVALVLQGSQNYRIDTPESDVDSKLFVTPTLEGLAKNLPAVSHTFIRKNEEHIDAKDIRLATSLFSHQNPNYMEVLFSRYSFVNPLYKEQWERLTEAREEIAHMNVNRAVRAILGMIDQKYFALEHPYPSKLPLIEKYGYDGKQLSHMLRLEEFMERYIAGEPYESCLIPREREYLITVKKNVLSLDTARELAAAALKHAEEMRNSAVKRYKDEDNPKMKALLEDVTYQIIRISLEKELRK